MAAWPGWAGDLLHVLGFKNSSGNLKFLSEWHSYEQTPCTNNPVSARHIWLAATLCGGGPKRNYRTRSDGLQATAAQLKQAKYLPIYDALKSGKPFHYSDNQGVVNALTAWGSLSFANKYATQGAPAPPQPKGTAPQVIGAYNFFAHSIDHNMKHALQDSARAVSHAYALLGHKHSAKG